MSGLVLVTGGTGYVAGWCIVELLNRGYRVRATVRSLSSATSVRESLAATGAPVSNLSFAEADLMSDEGWDTAVERCDHVMHVASPLGGGAPDDRYSLVTPARDGTLRVLSAAVKAGVKRVVMTSAAAATRPPLDSGRISEESNWADPDDSQFDAYRVSKILAERAAWDFMKERGGDTELTTILPGAVFGPILSKSTRGSVQIIGDLLEGRPPLMPDLGFWVVDVRDLAAAHAAAIESDRAPDQRFIVAGDFMWLRDVAGVLRKKLPEHARKVPSRRLPGFAVKLLLPFMPNLRSIAPLIGHRFPLTSKKAQDLLGFRPRPVAETLVDCAESLLL